MGGRGGGAPAGRQDAGVATRQPQSAPDAVLSAYRALVDQFDNDFVILTSLRAKLGSLTRAEQDSALMSLVRERKIRLIPEENQQTLTPADRAAAINVSGEEKHLIGIV